MKPVLVRLGGAERFTRLLAGAPATAGMKAGQVRLRPGESVGEHTTTAREEAIVVLEGRASVFCAGRPVFQAETDSMAYIPPETVHDIKNEGPEDLRYVYVVTPVPLAGIRTP